MGVVWDFLFFYHNPKCLTAPHLFSAKLEFLGSSLLRYSPRIFLFNFLFDPQSVPRSLLSKCSLLFPL